MNRFTILTLCTVMLLAFSCEQTPDAREEAMMELQAQRDSLMNMHEHFVSIHDSLSEEHTHLMAQLRIPETVDSSLMGRMQKHQAIFARHDSLINVHDALLASHEQLWDMLRSDMTSRAEANNHLATIGDDQEDMMQQHEQMNKAHKEIAEEHNFVREVISSTLIDKEEM